MSLPIYQVDAFTAERYAGNPAGVCLLEGPADAGWMQLVAREMNLPETAFLHPTTEGAAFQLRWFTPTTEVDLCGHATLASAHVLWESGQLLSGVQARFETRSGLLTAHQVGDWIELDFPATPAQPSQPPPGLLPALHLEPSWTGWNGFDYLVEVASEEQVRAVSPDFRQLASVAMRGVIVTAKSNAPGIDFVSRFFAPAAGIDEDPVTGSAHCTLAGFWGGRLGKRELVGYQASARGGIVRVRLEGPRVKLGGQAVTVVKGELL